MSTHILVNAGALKMLFNVMERNAVEQGRPVWQEMVDEVKKTIINVEAFDDNGKRGWVCSDGRDFPPPLKPTSRVYSRIPEENNNGNNKN